MSAPSSKRRRVEVSASVKRTICQYKEDHPKATIREVRQYIMNDSSIELGKSTIGDILKDKHKWLDKPADSLDMMRYRQPKNQQLEDALFLWFSDMSLHHAAINDEMLIMKAKTLGEQLNVTEFCYSRGWIQRFKNRRGIKRKLYEGEAESADMSLVHTGRDKLQQILKEYNPEDVFNLDESGLFFRLGPNYTLARLDQVWKR